MWAETFKPCSLRRMGFSEHEPWILPRFPAEFFSLLFFFFRAGFFLASVLTVFFVYVSLSSVLVYLPHV